MWTPGLDVLGPQTFTVIARSGPDALVASQPATVTVIFKTAFTVEHVGVSNISASPGETVPISATITNTGPQEDTLTLSLGITGAFWKHTGLPAKVTLQPGESIVVTANALVPTAQPLTYATISARSENNTDVQRQIRYTLTVLVRIELGELDHVENATQLPRATVKVTHLDGTPAVGAFVTVSQQPRFGGAALGTSASGVADANGEFAFDFTDEPGALTPGEHQLVVVAKKPGGVERTEMYAYFVGPNPATLPLPSL